MPSRVLRVTALLSLLWVGACANSTAVNGSGAAATAAEPVVEPELTLNLPEPGCICETQEGTDYTFLDKGISAIVAGEYAEAVTYFQRYQRLETSPQAKWEAGIAMAYLSMLPQNPDYDPTTALSAFKRLQAREPDKRRVHVKTLLMRDSLAGFAALQAALEDMSRSNRELSESLQKREEALKRLRELTLGQKVTAP
ncbi:MAG: hypothetical protein KDI09_02860 [Halioglobus sp.]|nr:hypothetical protein [Halioglobus sp.]